MKFVLCLGSCIFAFLLFVNPLHAILGDVNGDNKVSLEEAIFALQVVSGMSLQGKDETESNNIKTEATQTSANATISGKIGYLGDDLDWYKIIMPSNGLFHFSVENLNENAYIGRCYLYLEDGANLIELTYASESYGHYTEPGHLRFSSITTVYKNATYYIKVPQYEDNVVSYEIKTSFSELEIVETGESNDGYNEAQLIQKDDTITTLLGYGDDEADWYKIQMTANGQFQFSIQNLHPADVENGRIGRSYLYEKDGVNLVEITYASESYGHYTEPGNLRVSSKSAVYQNGIYYIKVPQYEHHAAPYLLETSFSELKTEDSGEVNDSYSEAQPVQENEIIVSLIGYGGDDADWYQIQISASGQFQFSIANLQSESVGNGRIGRSYLYEKDGDNWVELTYASESYGHYTEPGNLRISSKVSVSNDIYYIKVPKFEHHAAPYQLETSFTAD